MAIEKELLDRLLAGRGPSEAFGKDGVPDDLKKALSERILNAGLPAFFSHIARNISKWAPPTTSSTTSRLAVPVSFSSGR